jgi:ADP-ribosylglycohydrolase
MKQKIKDAFFGFAVGDALGVPVEFRSREDIAKNPVTDMREFGTHHQPKGTWSDDSSMAFCLAESLATPIHSNKKAIYDINDIANNFVKWKYEKFWTPHGRVFDIGIATRDAIKRLKKGEGPLLAGGVDEYSNGNGSLMRILPLVFYKGYFFEDSIKKRYELVSEVSAITHGHFRSIFSCFIYTEFARILLKQTDKNKFSAYNELQILITDFAIEFNFNKTEIALFDRILKNDITTFETETIKSSGYVLHTLEASFWCFLKYDSYSESVLKSVNLGEDTDTTGCVTGGIAGLFYGINTENNEKGIPKEWLNVIVKKEEITNLCEKLYDLNLPNTSL